MGEQNIREPILEFIKEATPRQKALMICKEFLEKETMNEPKTITEEEMIAVKESLQNGEERAEYLKWVRIYNVYSELTPLFGLVYKEYQTEAERVLGYLRLWEAYNQEEDHLNAIYQALLDKKDKEGLETFNRSISNLRFSNAKIKRDKDGYVEIDIEPLYQKIMKYIEGVKESYSAAKAIVLVTERYTKKTHSSAFRPVILVNAIDRIKEDYVLHIAPRYSRKQLKEIEDKGLPITEEERKRAIFPYYEEIVAPDRLIEMFEQRLKAIEAYE